MMQNPTPPQLLATAIAAARAAGQHALNNKERRTESTETVAHDIKLVLDVECQHVAESTILKQYPDHGILGEEGCHSAPSETCEWIIDPIDGTLNYSHGFPYWCSSVAVRQNGKIVAGCVYAPEFDACYSAHIDGPAELNGTPISVSPLKELHQAMLCTGLSKYFETDQDRHFGLFQRLALGTSKLRINGAAALDLCHTAAGTSDGFFETGIYLWDFAAGGLIAERAGATLDIHPQADGTYTVICANPHLIGELQALHPPE